MHQNYRANRAALHSIVFWVKLRKGSSLEQLILFVPFLFILQWRCAKPVAKHAREFLCRQACYCWLCIFVPLLLSLGRSFFLHAAPEVSSLFFYLLKICHAGSKLFSAGSPGANCFLSYCLDTCHDGSKLLSACSPGAYHLVSYFVNLCPKTIHIYATQGF